MGEEIGSWSKILFEDSDIVFDYTLDVATDQLEINNLNLTKDDIYDIHIEGSASENTDVLCRFNDITISNYWQMGKYYENSLSSDLSNFDYTTGVRTQKTSWYYAHRLLTNMTTIDATLMLAPKTATDYSPQYSWRSKCVWNGNQYDSDVFGVHGSTISNITKITYTTNSGNFNEGTRFIIKKRKK